ncbi:hypothetical protein ARMA_1284 [Ardenticatena maritima]|uniref:Uncharacterized protein n=1 Tax=Ardenticatena maritima TaxID=872965 RepID=A0A0M8K8E6_9CHLR|nr:hypothetical protein ARMA_1284 [Ardenticatena maritima]
MVVSQCFASLGLYAIIACDFAPPALVRRRIAMKGERSQ